MKEHNFYADISNNFEPLSSSPVPFLEGNSNVSDGFVKVCKMIYDFSKDTTGLTASDPLPHLIIENFDNEQVWQEIELFNKTEAATSLKCAEMLSAKRRSVNLIHRKKLLNVGELANVPEDEEEDMDEDPEDEDSGGSEKESEIGSDEEEGFHFEESDDQEEEEDEMDADDNNEEVERSEVDDDFFSLRQMEKFLEAEDRKFENDFTEPNNDDIDYFEDLPSDDDEEYSQEIESKSSRHLLYSDYFPSPSCVEGKDYQNTADDDEMLSKVRESNKRDFPNANTPLSSYEKQKEQTGKKIQILEEKSLEPAQWQLKGEVKATNRPENSLLQEMVSFDHVARPPVEITEEHTRDLESLIKQRVLDCAWDDVERKAKPKDDPIEYKKRIVLDSSQSKLTLSEIYEKEYLEKNRKEDKDEFEEKESEAHSEIRKEMKDLFRKLDALSNFHFTAATPEPKIKIVSNLPSITMEEVQPVTHSEGQTLAPEEIFEKSGGGEMKSEKEKSSTDRKRERRKKKLKMKARAQARLEKLKQLDPNSEKVKKMEAMKNLRNAAKAPSGNTTILKDSSKSEKITSQKFFSQLQDHSNSQPLKKKKKAR